MSPRLHRHVTLLACLPLFAASGARVASAASGQPGIQLSRPKTPLIAAVVTDTITLEVAVRRALDNNRTIQQQRLALRSAELAHKTAWDTMFVPQTTLTAGSSSAYSFTSVQGRDTAVARDHGYPGTSVELNLGTYTLFNFWRDWNVYEQSDLDWKRANEVYTESVRAVRFQVILAYFRLKAEQEKLDSSARSVQISDAILELVKSRVRRKQATESDVSSSSVDLLNAKNEFAQRESAERAALWSLNQLLGDPVGTAYLIKDTVRFTPVSLTQAQALKIYWEQAPTVKNGKRDLRKAELAVELAEKNQLPLPKVTFSGVTLSYQNAYDSGTYSPYGQSLGNPNVGVAAAVAVSLPIYGPNGFFNHRQVAQAEIARENAGIGYVDASSRDVAGVFGAFAEIKRNETTILNDQQVFEKSTALLDDLFSRLSTSTVSRLELRDALTQARNSELNLLESNISHLTNKLTLAQLIGVDRLPGDLY